MNAIEYFVRTLREQVLELNLIHQAHIEDYGELLPHVFLGDVTRFVLRVANDPGLINQLKPLLLRIEAGLRSDDEELANFVAVSFIENLCGEEEALCVLAPLMGMATRRELEKICGYSVGNSGSSLRSQDKT